MAKEQHDRGRAVIVSDVDADAVELMDIGGQLCFHSRLLEDPRLPDPGPGVCNVRRRDLLPLANDPRSGLKIATRGDRIVGYAIFGRPELYPNRQMLDRLDMPVREDGLLIGAIYATPGARADNADIDLLVAVMDFARENDYEYVQAVGHVESDDEPEARADILRASGFSLGEPVDGICLAEITLEEWDSESDETPFEGEAAG